MKASTKIIKNDINFTTTGSCLCDSFRIADGFSAYENVNTGCIDAPTYMAAGSVVGVKSKYNSNHYIMLRNTTRSVF